MNSLISRAVLTFLIVTISILRRLVLAAQERKSVSRKPRSVVTAADRRHNDRFVVGLDPEALLKLFQRADQGRTRVDVPEQITWSFIVPEPLLASKCTV